MKNFFLLALFCGCLDHGFTQTTKQTSKEEGSITGNILDARSGKALALASISLKRLGDSAKNYSIVSDKNGVFAFQKLRYGYYHLGVQVIGYAKMQVDSISVREDHAEVNIGDIRLNESSASLDEVVVYSEKPLLENKDGKITYNVAESPLSNGANASELLKNMPLINVNPDGTILLRGKAPLILMDEKPTNLNPQQLTELLESLPANVIEKVEIMVNPPPEYATHEGGVINIVTKKGRVGIYAKLTATAGSRGEASLASNISYRSAKLNLGASIGIGEAEAKGNSYSHRENFYRDSVNYFYSQSSYFNKSKSPNLRLQADYEINKNQSLGFVYQGNLNYFDNSSITFYTNLDSQLHIYRASSRSNQYNGTGYSHGISGSYQWKGKNPVEKLQVYTGFNAGKNDNTRDFYQQFLQPDFLPTGFDSTQSQFFDNYVNSYYARANYNKPLNDTGTFSFTSGVSFTSGNYHNLLNTRFLRKQDNLFVYNDRLSNDFYFDQGIFTVRVGILASLPFKWRLITGVQAEYTHTRFRFIKGNASNSNNGYWRLLPNFTLRKDISKSLNMAFVFRESIRRPGINELNPSIDYGDPYNIRFGNPYLQPSLTDNFDLNIGYNQKKININVSFGYNKVKNVFNSIRTLIDSGKTQITYYNISDQDEYQFGLWSGITLSRKLRVNLSSGMNYNQYSPKEKLLYRYKDGGSFYSGLNFSYAPDNLTILEGNSRYSSFANPQGTTRTNISMSFGVQRKFLNKKLLIAISANDPFGLLNYKGSSYGTNFQVESFSVSNTQNFRLTLSYQLSKVMLKNSLSEKEKKDALDKLKAK